MDHLNAFAQFIEDVQNYHYVYTKLRVHLFFNPK